MECVGWGARLWEGADISTFICFLLSFFLPRCGLAGATTGTAGTALAKAEGRPRLGLPGVCLCHPACKSPLQGSSFRLSCPLLESHLCSR